MLTDDDVSKAATSLTTIGWGKTKPVVLNRKRKTWTQWQAEKWSETKWQFFPCIFTCYSFHVTFYMVFSIWFCSNRHTYSFSSTVALHSSEKQIRPGLIRGFYLPCPQWAGFSRFTRKNNGWLEKRWSAAIAAAQCQIVCMHFLFLTILLNVLPL